MTKKITKEDYLETIYNLEQESGFSRISDIAQHLKISKPSVTQMVQKMAEEGYLDYTPYSPLQLTAKGQKIGQDIAERHQVLSEFLTLLDIPPDIQEKDIHGIEHYLSPVTFERLKKVTLFLQKHRFRGSK